MSLEVEDDGPQHRSENVIYSLNLEDVNDNTDELIDLRGRGRYFGNADDPLAKETEFLCRNCHEPGHRALQCKTVICVSCGQRNDHYTEQCPKSITCTNCGEKGHYRSACTKQQKRSFCIMCESNRHNSDRCPSIWRSYLASKGLQKLVYPFRFIYCYNCAEKGHYGDDCPQRRSLRVPNIDGSAFSGDNLPKGLRNQYFQLLRRNRKRDADEFEDESDGTSAPNFVQYDYLKENKRNVDVYEITKVGKKQKKKNQKRQKLEAGVQPKRSGTLGPPRKVPQSRSSNDSQNWNNRSNNPDQYRMNWGRGQANGRGHGRGRGQGRGQGKGGFNIQPTRRGTFKNNR